MPEYSGENSGTHCLLADIINGWGSIYVNGFGFNQ
jgi:hypothetical protein